MTHIWRKGWFTLSGRRHRVSYVLAAFLSGAVGGLLIGGAFGYMEAAKSHGVSLSSTEWTVIGIMLVIAVPWLLVTAITIMHQRLRDIGWAPTPIIAAYLIAYFASYAAPGIIAQVAACVVAVIALLLMFWPPQGEEFAKVGSC